MMPIGAQPPGVPRVALLRRGAGPSPGEKRLHMDEAIVVSVLVALPGPRGGDSAHRFPYSALRTARPISSMKKPKPCLTAAFAMALMRPMALRRRMWRSIEVIAE